MRNPFLSNGTHIVTRSAALTLQGDSSIPAGSVGMVVKNSTGNDNEMPYLIRFADNREAYYFRSQLEIKSHFQETPEGQTTRPNLYPYVIFRCVVGSRAYGLEQEGSDTDRRGIFVPPAELHWSLNGVPEQLENDATQEVYWEIQKFLNLALKANPNVLECLYTPLIEHADPLAQELLDQKEIFLSKLVYQTYCGYAISQFKKMDQDLRARGEIRWKHAMHLVRLLLTLVTVLKEGTIPLSVGDYREELLAIRNGQVSWPELNARRLDLQRQSEAAFIITRLPDRPDYDRANLFLLKARRTALELN